MTSDESSLRRENAELRRRLLETQAAARMIGGMAHEFNNLLTAILGYAQLLSARTSDEASRRRLEEIRTAAEKAAALTRQLVEASDTALLGRPREPAAS